ncbi:hypothetical protein AB9E29_21010 [Rhizobium leguminosarum]|uniref:hypothetical protein n=1 Tax=Rhizobium leguminosarum TaxID=384 RepID=UPI003F99E466
MEVSEQDNEGLQNIVDNHRRLGQTQRPAYLAAMEELSRRGGNGLSFRKTLMAILAAAREERFISYKGIADQSGAEWSRVHWAMGKHLGELLEYAHRRGWPLVTSIVVNQLHVETGQMKPESLEGFLSMARSLGFEVTDELTFLIDQQQNVFKWAKDFTLEGEPQLL